MKMDKHAIQVSRGALAGARLKKKDSVGADPSSGVVITHSQ